MLHFRRRAQPPNFSSLEPPRANVPSSSKPSLKKETSINLSSGIPKLQSDGPVLQVHGLREEVDSNGSLVGVVEGVVHLVCEFEWFQEVSELSDTIEGMIEKKVDSRNG